MTRLIDADALLEAIKADRYTNASDAIYFITNAPTVQREGWLSVPIEPTWEMTNNASENTDVNSFIDINNVWQAMIQAAPKE